MIFKCKNCGGNVVYNPDKHKMTCPFCESEDSQERREYPSQNSFGESTINICPNCGGSVEVKEHTSATQCPYCENYLILNERIEGEYTPKTIIPFQLGKEKCKEIIRSKFKSMAFAPTDFLSEVKLNSMQGTYVPFWFYNYDTNCDFQGEGTKIRSWSAGDMRYTETSYYNVARNMDIDFRNIPADASIEMPDDVMDLMAPYNYGQLTEFKPEYMSGFYAEKYNMTSDLIENRAKDKMNKDAQNILKGSYTGYANVRTIKNSISSKKSWADYGLLPVWKYIYHYKDKDYPFYVNGQTGKLVGTAPVSKAKIWTYAGTLWASMTLIMIFINIFLKGF
jgi:DNA-directed RNA polymerase subunit RPC12/RpoP